MSAQLLNDDVTWIPANPAGLDDIRGNQMIEIPLAFTELSVLSLDPDDPFFYEHFNCLGLLERSPLFRDRRTGEIFWPSVEIVTNSRNGHLSTKGKIDVEEIRKELSLDPTGQ